MRCCIDFSGNRAVTACDYQGRGEKEPIGSVSLKEKRECTNHKQRKS